jgi:hypothetical protein
MLNPLEAARHVFDLPALLGANLLALDATARAGTLSGAQLVDVRGDREFLEVRQGTSAPAPLHPPQFVRGLARRRLIRRNRFLRQLLAEGEQRLPDLLARLQPVGARPVVPLLVALQLQLQTEILEVERVGTLDLARGQGGFFLGQGFVLGGALLGAIALGERRPQPLFRRGGVVGQGRGFGGRHTCLDVVIAIWLLTWRNIFRKWSVRPAAGVTCRAASPLAGIR